MTILRGKIVVITGASGGLGKEIAIQTAKQGASVVLLARSMDKLIELRQMLVETFQVEVFAFQLDVANSNDVSAVFEQIAREVGEVDILVNNAGFGIFESFNEASFADIRSMFEVNVLGLMACTKAVLPSMIERNTGHIINIASQAGKLATPKSSGYSATKHAVLGFTNSLRLELAKTKIYVSAVNPGPIETSFFNIADKSGNYVKNVKKFMLQSDDVAKKITKLMIHPKRELNLPKWMNMGSVLYNLFPNISEKLVGKTFDKK